MQNDWLLMMNPHVIDSYDSSGSFSHRGIVLPFFSITVVFGAG